MELLNKTAVEIGKMIQDKKVSSVEVTKFILQKIKKENKIINAYTNIFEEQAILKAKEIQEKIDKKEINSPLAGVPFAIKENIYIKGNYSTSCSKLLKNNKASYSATVLEKLENAGSIVLGQLNMDELAMGGSTQTSCFGVTKNPWDLNRVPGGSSGGSAASVASNQAFFSLGTDTGGSIRQPCSFCNITGLKPTYGTVSRYGVIPLSPSLDQVGPMTKDVIDCATVLNVISGYDDKDCTTYKKKLDFSNSFNNNIKNIKIGIPKNYFDENLDYEVKKNVLSSVDVLKNLGAQFEEFDLDINECSVATYYILSCVEAISSLKCFVEKENYNLKDFISYLGSTAKTRVLLGNFVLSDKYKQKYYEQALKFRKYICFTFKKAFEKYDLLLTPVCQTTAFRLGEVLSKEQAERRYFGDIYTVATNLAGIPAISIPCGFSKNNLPIGMQLIGNYFSEPTIVNVSYAFQSITDFHKKRSGF